MTNTTSNLKKLNDWTQYCLEFRPTSIGYPCNQNRDIQDFYQWYLQSGLCNVNLNNAGSPMEATAFGLNTHVFEKEVLQYFAPHYGFDNADMWGIVTNSGTDGNNHGIYFGANILLRKTGKLPIVYVSKEAHYSNMRLCDLQNLEIRLIQTDTMGRMSAEDLDRQLDPTRGCLIIYAVGSTFKGAIDDIPTLNAVLAKHPNMPVYRHVDAALFGGYLPFTPYKNLVNKQVMDYQSISISGHKFFGIDSPSGLFFTTQDIYDKQDNFEVTYINSNMKMLSCSRDAIQPLKLWWLIQRLGTAVWTKQANDVLVNTSYLIEQLVRIHWPHWCNEYSNTVMIRRPKPEIILKYNLACGYEEAFGGELAHVVVMQHVDRPTIDTFIQELQNSL